MMKLLLAICLSLVAACPVSYAGQKEEGEAEEDVLTADDLPTPIADANVGDWVLYKMANGDTMKLTVAEKWDEHGEDYLVIRSETKTGERRKRRTRTEEKRICVQESVKDLRTLSPYDYIVRGEMMVDGRRLKVFIINFVEDGTVIAQTYLSSRVPVHGLVRGVTIEDNKRVVEMTLHDFGFAEDEDDEESMR